MVTNKLFADYEPQVDAQTTVSPRIDPLSHSTVTACAALAAAREGDPVERWLPVFAQRATADPVTTFVAHVDQHFAGYASMSWLSPGKDGAMAPEGWYLTGLVVAPEWRRHGVGAALTQHRLTVLAEITSEVYYFASALNRPTIDLHAQLGFQELTTDFQFPGVTFSGGTGHLFRLAL